MRKYSSKFSAPERAVAGGASTRPNRVCIAVTGATGSLGAHIVAHLAGLVEVDSIVCLNRHSMTADPVVRQQQAFEARGISLDASSMAKVQILGTDTRATRLGLSQGDYQDLVGSVTHIVHNAWPMTSKRPVGGLEAQFQIMRNLIDFAQAAASVQNTITFQFVSSIATVGHYPFRSGNVLVPEERMDIESVLPNGYGEAKFVCERILDETLHQYPDSFRVMTVRPGQIAGSSTSGYWNPQEHLCFLLKSSQTLKSLPDFDGDLCWTPVDQASGTLCDLLLSPRATDPIYHIDNPVRQPWKQMISVLADLLGVDSTTGVVPFEEWLRRVRSFQGPVRDNPAAQLVDFLDDNFIRMSCGGLLLDTAKAYARSPTLTSVGPVENATVQKYIDYWKDMGFL